MYLTRSYYEANVVFEVSPPIRMTTRAFVRIGKMVGVEDFFKVNLGSKPDHKEPYIFNSMRRRKTNEEEMSKIKSKAILKADLHRKI